MNGGNTIHVSSLSVIAIRLFNTINFYVESKECLPIVFKPKQLVIASLAASTIMNVIVNVNSLEYCKG